MTFDEWWKIKCDTGYFNAEELAKDAWKSGQREALLEAAKYADKQASEYSGLLGEYAKGRMNGSENIAIELRCMAKELAPNLQGWNHIQVEPDDL
jgi:hypothetical protein